MDNIKEFFDAAAKSGSIILTENKEKLHILAEQYQYPLLNIIDYKDLESGNYYLGSPVMIYDENHFIKNILLNKYGLTFKSFSPAEPEKYDYLTAMKADIMEYIQDNNIDLYELGDGDRWRAEDNLVDMLWAEDCVTGNGGMYYGSNEECKRYIIDNLDTFFSVMEEYDLVRINEITPQYIDCMIRTYYLHQAVYDVVNELWEDKEDERSTED